MVVYTGALLWALILSIIVRPSYSQNRLRRNPNGLISAIVLSVVASAPLVFLLAFRKDVGTDYASYVSIYDAFQHGAPLWWYEPLYSALNIAAVSIGDGGVVLVFAMAASLSTIPLVFRIFRNSELPWLSFVILFGIAYPFMQTNAVRSVIAVSVFFFLLPVIWNNKPWYWVVGSIFAAGFHYTAIVMLPFYWLLRIKVSFFFAVMSFLCANLLATQKNIALLFLKIAPSFLPSNYAHYPARAAANLDTLRFGPGYAWYFVSAVFVLVLWRRVGRMGGAETVIRNSFFFGLIVIIAAYQFETVGRIGWYFYISGVLFWPLIAFRLFSSGRSVVILCISVVHMVMFAYAGYTGAHDATPYYSIFD